MRSKKAILNIVSNLALQIIIIIYGFIVPKVIITHFGSNVNGLISSITQFLAYISLLESGFGPVVKAVLYKPISEKDNKEIACILKTSEKFFRNISKVFILYIIVLCFIYPLIINNNFDKIFTISLILIISISTFAEYFFGMTYKLFLQADQKNYIISFIQAVTYIISVFVVIIFAYLNMNIQIIKLVSGLVFVLRPILQNWYVKKKYNINFKDVKKDYVLKQKWDGLAQHIAAVIHGNTDIAILSIMCNLSEVSVYSVYNLVVKGIKQFAQIFSNGIDSLFGDMIAKKEHHNLNEKFELYEVLYFTIIAILFSSTIILITPFIGVYTKEIMDANYIRYTFGYLIVISEYIWAIRLPYSSLTLAAGHFKETRTGAWVECISNIVLSIILVTRYGLIGVAIGTVIAMLLRTIEFIYHTNKYILKRSIFNSLRKILILIFETLIIVFMVKFLPLLNNTSYFNWTLNSLMVCLLACGVVFMFNIFLYKKELSNFKAIIKKMIRRKKQNFNHNDSI